MSDGWTVGFCGNERPHHPHQVMEYTGEDDTYDIWCLGVQGGVA